MGTRFTIMSPRHWKSPVLGRLYINQSTYHTHHWCQEGLATAHLLVDLARPRLSRALGHEMSCTDMRLIPILSLGWEGLDREQIPTLISSCDGNLLLPELWMCWYFVITFYSVIMVGHYWKGRVTRCTIISFQIMYIESWSFLVRQRHFVRYIH